ncbi:3-phosphoserine/phosphohydroxythreonine transaminase [Vallitalea okinawensis]|uniref:3-phosphoserine/phosphohydroxythreonine transaminase n=1 Tax=Vallitalea okinawensis TaxID=2078660 RepID=UPI000CFD2A0B|nr:3-phosphoserine/phosphohydroxythreonine transaminase [Vallitalea okinawensis]
MERVYNFSAGPSTLPEKVLTQASKEMLNYRNAGMSVMEMSHRSKVYDEIIKEAEALLRELLSIPNEYEVLFLQGGASTQFAMVPLNLLSENGTADYIDTGAWSKKAIAEAKKFGNVNVLASSEDANYTYIPNLNDLTFTKDADYIHITTNNTIYGTQFNQLPNVEGVPLVADMSSNILAEKINVNDFGVIFAGAQKNMGPAGVTIVIMKKDLIKKAGDNVPTMLQYKIHADKDSMFNTPPTYSIYVCKLVFEWLKELGGIDAIEKMNRAKAKLLYDCIDESKLFKGPVKKEDRSLMNVPFITGNPDLDTQFIKEAGSKGLVNIKGHRSVGGMRASIYNAMPVEGVKALVNVMKDFEVTHG